MNKYDNELEEMMLIDLMEECEENNDWHAYKPQKEGVGPMTTLIGVGLLIYGVILLIGIIL